MDDVDDKVTVTAFMSGLRTHKFLFSLEKEPRKSMADLILRAQKHINTEDAMNARHDRDQDAGSRSDKKKRPADDNREDKEKKTQQTDKLMVWIEGVQNQFADFDHNFTPLTAPLEHVPNEIRNDQDLKWPKWLRSPPEQRNQRKYYQFQRDHGHNTDDCIDLKQQIENLIRQGRLGRFVAGRGRDRPRAAE